MQGVARRTRRAAALSTDNQVKYLWHEDRSLRNLLKTAIPRPARNWLRSPGTSLRWWLHEARYIASGPVTLTVRADENGGAKIDHSAAG